jgi:hypothetical protein
MEEMLGSKIAIRLIKSKQKYHNILKTIKSQKQQAQVKIGKVQKENENAQANNVQRMIKLETLIWQYWKKYQIKF